MRKIAEGGVFLNAGEGEYGSNDPFFWVYSMCPPTPPMWYCYFICTLFDDLIPGRNNWREIAIFSSAKLALVEITLIMTQSAHRAHTVLYKVVLINKIWFWL